MYVWRITVKSCPICNRTYADDAFTFCLVDGSILSPPYDPHQTQRIPTPQSTNSDITEVLPPASRLPDQAATLHPTISSPQPTFLYSQKPSDRSQAKQDNKSWYIIRVGLLLVGILAVMITVGFILFGTDKAGDNQSNSNTQNDNTVYDKKTKPDLAGNWESYNSDGGWRPTSIRQEGNMLWFTNESANTSAGYYESATRVKATGWGNLGATIRENRINWDNGSIWRRRSGGMSGGGGGSGFGALLDNTTFQGDILIYEEL